MLRDVPDRHGVCGNISSLAEGAPPNIETQFLSLITMLKAIGAPALLDVGQLHEANSPEIDCGSHLWSQSSHRRKRSYDQGPCGGHEEAS